MSPRQLELTWLGGATERRLRRRRPGLAELPWGAVAACSWSGAALAEARAAWTNAVFTEYASAAAFSSLATACLESGAPIDLVATIADCAVDELAHVELASRLLAELGGAAPYEADLEAVAPRPTPGARAVLRAAEIAITTSCVGEALSLPALRHARRSTTNPLARAVVARLLADEGPHARVGFTLLAWAEDRLTPGDREHLAEVALDAIHAYAPLWQGSPCADCPATAVTATLDAGYRRALSDAVITRIARPLAQVGVDLDPARVAAIARPYAA